MLRQHIATDWPVVIYILYVFGQSSSHGNNCSIEHAFVYS